MPTADWRRDMGARILLYRCHRALKALENADRKLTDLWYSADRSDRAEIRELSNALTGLDTKEQKDAVLEAQEIIRVASERERR